MFHELGHSVTADYLGYGVKVKWFKTIVAGEVSVEDDKKIVVGGFLAGFIPILVYSFGGHPFMTYGMVLVYLVGIRKELWRVIK